MRLIDADALYIPPEEMNAKMAVAYAPTIDAVPVVRCKDCKWYDGQEICDRHGLFLIDLAYFCADGERKAMIDFGADLQRAYDDGYRARDAEIVRCKDCRCYLTPDPDGHATGYCIPWEKGIEPMSFCSEAERKYDEQMR